MAQCPACSGSGTDSYTGADGEHLSSDCSLCDGTGAVSDEEREQYQAESARKQAAAEAAGGDNVAAAAAGGLLAGALVAMPTAVGAVALAPALVVVGAGALVGLGIKKLFGRK